MRAAAARKQAGGVVDLDLEAIRRAEHFHRLALALEHDLGERGQDHRLAGALQALDRGR